MLVLIGIFSFLTLICSFFGMCALLAIYSNLKDGKDR
nr:MAG TPA: transporter [Caudoviricetes sp.]